MIPSPFPDEFGTSRQTTRNRDPVRDGRAVRGSGREKTVRTCKDKSDSRNSKEEPFLAHKDQMRVENAKNDTPSRKYQAPSKQECRRPNQKLNRLQFDSYLTMRLHMEPVRSEGAKSLCQKTRDTLMGRRGAPVSIATDIRRSTSLAHNAMARSTLSSVLCSVTGKKRVRRLTRRRSEKRNTSGECKRVETSEPMDLDSADFVKLSNMDSPPVSEARYTLTNRWEGGKGTTEIP